VIDQFKDQHPVQTLCEMLDLPRSTYYDSKNKTESNRARENKELTEEITKIHHESKKRYGSPKIQKELVKKGYSVSQKRVHRLMKKAGLRSIITKKYRPQTSSNAVVELQIF
jgi:putative transposase